VLGQVKTGEKSNEITAIPELLDRLEVKGDTITIDACDRVSEGYSGEDTGKRGGLCATGERKPAWAVPGDQRVFRVVEENWGRNPSTDVWRSGLEKNHGRQENWEVLTEEDRGWLNGKEKWKDIRAIIW
jgi:predicted transposase YbfD/YdcC